MTTATLNIPNIEVELTVEQLITAVRQLEVEERAIIARALTEDELDTELAQLIVELYSQPPIDDISDDDILAEIRAVRQPQASKPLQFGKYKGNRISSLEDFAIAE